MWETERTGRREGENKRRRTEREREKRERERKPLSIEMIAQIMLTYTHTTPNIDTVCTALAELAETDQPKDT